MTQDTVPPEYILYIQGSDINGLKALRYVQHFPSMFLVRDVDDLMKIPDWLIGTPSLLSLKTKKLYRGTHALQKLISIKDKLNTNASVSPPKKIAQKEITKEETIKQETTVKKEIKQPEIKQQEIAVKTEEKTETKKEGMYDPLPKANVSQEKLKSQAEEIFTPFPKPDKDVNNPNPPQVVATPLPGSVFRETKTTDSKTTESKTTENIVPLLSPLDKSKTSTNETTA